MNRSHLPLYMALLAGLILIALAAAAPPAVSSELPVPPDPPKVAAPFFTVPGFASEAEVRALRRELAQTKRRARSLRAELQREHGRYTGARRRVGQLARVLRQRPTTREAIDLACTIYGNCSTLWRIARCESGYSPTAHNPSGASGLFQFLPSTWAGTPFGRFSIWSPYANALAAGWMWQRGRGGEWVCR